MAKRRKASPYETKEFLELRKQWYGKLKADGFRDIEFVDWESGESGNLLNGFGHMDAVKRGQDVFFETERYFQLAKQYVWEIEGRVSDPHHEMWRLHADGVSNHGIAKQMEISRDLVNATIHELREAFLLWVRMGRPESGE